MRKVLLEAPILTQSGYGEHSRFVFRALADRTDIDLYIHPLGWGTTGWITEDNEERRTLDSLIQKTTSYTVQSNNEPHYDAHIHVGIPSEFEKKAAYAVHVTAGIETTKISTSWLEKTFQMDKIIVPSNHAKWAFENTTYEVENNGKKFGVTCRTPIDVIPYPVKKITADKKFNIDLEYDFNFLSVALWGPRKNMENMISWFVSEFKDDEVGLVLKTGCARGSIIDRRMTEVRLKHVLSRFQDRTCKVYLLHGDLTEEEMTALYKHKKIKAMISASHGEGFGLPLFEAAINEMPVVAPGWSGHMDFLRAPVRTTGKAKAPKMKDLFAKVEFTMQPVQKEAVWSDIIIEDSMWCFPKEVSFRNQIRNVQKNHGMYKTWAKKLRKHIVKEFEEASLLKKMANSIVGEETSSIAENLAALQIRNFE